MFIQAGLTFLWFNKSGVEFASITVIQHFFKDRWDKNKLSHQNSCIDLNELLTDKVPMKT